MNEITFIYEDENKELLKFENIFYELLEITSKNILVNVPLVLSVNYILEKKAIEMNIKHRDKDYVADVLSFPIDDEYGIYNQIGFKEIGDIFICFDEAKRKANKLNHSIETEMSWLFVHGLLHILGYDHETNESDAKIMFELTDKILAEKNMKYEME